MRVCPEGQPCSSDCLCSLANVLSFLNPAKLRPETRICDASTSNGTCIDRENLVESLKYLLYPPKGTTVVDYFGTDEETSKEEL
jgi:hypothetical protein